MENLSTHKNSARERWARNQDLRFFLFTLHQSITTLIFFDLLMARYLISSRATLIQPSQNLSHRLLCVRTKLVSCTTKKSMDQTIKTKNRREGSTSQLQNLCTPTSFQRFLFPLVFDSPSSHLHLTVSFNCAPAHTTTEKLAMWKNHSVQIKKVKKVERGLAQSQNVVAAFW